MTPTQLVTERIKELGYSDILSFFSDAPGQPYGVLLKRIAKLVEGKNYLDIPIMALKLVHQQQAIEQAKVREYAMDTLVRTLSEHLGSGWACGKDWKHRSAQAYSTWPTPPELQMRYERVWSALKEIAPPKKWRPAPLEDELIKQAFDIGWPVDEVS